MKTAKGSKIDLVKYLTALVLFGLNGIVASRISLSSYEIVFTRTLVGSLFLILLFVFLKGKIQFFRNRTHAAYLVISGMAMGANFMFLFEAYVHVGVSIATLAYCCGPVIVMLLSPLVFKERITAVKVVGLLSVIAGMFCVNARALSCGFVPRGLSFGFLAAVMYAVMVVFNKKAHRINGLENPMWQLIIGFLTIAVFVGAKTGFAMQIRPADIIPILILGLVNTGLGCYFYFSSIGSLKSQTVAVCGCLEPLCALIFSAMFLGELLKPVQILGAVLVLGGVVLGEINASESLREER